MRKIKNSYILIVLSILIFYSCVPRKELIYFQNSEENKEIKRNNFKLRYKKNDELRIDVSSSDIEAVKPFNLAVVAYNASNGAPGGQPVQQTYFIDNNGDINFPLLGKIKLEGLTWFEATEMLRTKLKEYVDDVTVNINLVNFRINVIGDVTTPGSFIVPNARISVIDAIALAGDLSITGVRVVEIKRETPTGVLTGFIDLKSNDIYSSPFYYLEQNDVVYVRPNGPKSQSASFNKNAGVLISTVSIIISLIAVITR